MSRSASFIRLSTRLAIYLRDKLTCMYCGATAPACRLTLDHVNGAKDHRVVNLVTACWSCNSSRKKSTVRQFCMRRGLRYSVVQRRIKTQTSKQINGYRDVVNLMLDRGTLPVWLENIRRGSVESPVQLNPATGEALPSPTDADIPF